MFLYPEDWRSLSLPSCEFANQKDETYRVIFLKIYVSDW